MSTTKKRRHYQGAQRRKFYTPERYNQKMLRKEREYGLFWYDWLWKILRPTLIFVCSLLIVIGGVTYGWNKVYENFLMPPEPDSSTAVTFTIESGSSISAIGEKLVKENLLRNRHVFKYMVQFMGLTNSISYGTYTLSPAMTVNEIIAELSSGSQTNERTIRIIPGWTCEDIADYLYAEDAITSREEFLALLNDVETFAPSSYGLSDALQHGTLEGRKYALEGYLAPDTYQIFKSATPRSIILTLLEQDNSVIDDVFYSDNTQYATDAEGNYYEVDMYQSALSIDQTITMASMIEKEAGKVEDYVKVSAVLHNRLTAGWRLESDPTATYLTGVNKLVLSEEEIGVVNDYNTYIIQGLPVGPICNPSPAAIKAALYPDMDYIAQGYMFFCAKEPTSGELAFAITYEEHTANVEKYRPMWEEYDRLRAAAEEGQELLLE